MAATCWARQVLSNEQGMGMGVGVGMNMGMGMGMGVGMGMGMGAVGRGLHAGQHVTHLEAECQMAPRSGPQSPQWTAARSK